MHARKQWFRFLAIAAVATAALTSALAQGRKEVILPEKFHAEGIARASDGTLYVGSMGTGAIARIRPGAAAEVFITAEQGEVSGGIIGVDVDEKRDILYACASDNGMRRFVENLPHAPFGPSSLKAFRLSTGKLIATYPTPPGGHCNDLTVDANGNVFATDTRYPRIHLLRAGASALETWTDADFGAQGNLQLNGIAMAADGRSLYVNLLSSGAIMKIPVSEDLRPGVARIIPLPRPIARADGIEVIDANRLVVCEADSAGGNGRLTLITLPSTPAGQARMEVLASFLDSPTNSIRDGNFMVVAESQVSRMIVEGRRFLPPLPHRLVYVPLPRASN